MKKKSSYLSFIYYNDTISNYIQTKTNLYLKQTQKAFDLLKLIAFASHITNDRSDRRQTRQVTVPVRLTVDSDKFNVINMKVRFVLNRTLEIQIEYN